MLAPRQQVITPAPSVPESRESGRGRPGCAERQSPVAGTRW